MQVVEPFACDGITPLRLGLYGLVERHLCEDLITLFELLEHLHTVHIVGHADFGRHIDDGEEEVARAVVEIECIYGDARGTIGHMRLVRLYFLAVFTVAFHAYLIAVGGEDMEHDSILAVIISQVEVR